MKMESPKDQIVYPAMVSNLAARAKTIFAGDLSYFCTEDDLYRLFSAAGNIVNVSIARKSDTSLMYGFVEFETSEKAEQITADFNGQMFMGRNLRVFALGNYTGPASSFPNNKPESFCVHVSFVTHNLHKLIDEEYLREVFNSFGDVFDVAIRRYYRQRQRQYGYAFVDFLSKQSAVTAAESWQEKDHDGVCIKCTLGHRVTGNDDALPNHPVEKVEKHKSSNHSQNRPHRKDLHNSHNNNNSMPRNNLYPNHQVPPQHPYPMIPPMMPEMMAYPMPNPMMLPPGGVPPMAMTPHYFTPFNPTPIVPVSYPPANTTSATASPSDMVFVPPPMMTQTTPTSAMPVNYYPHYFNNNAFVSANGSPHTNSTLKINKNNAHAYASSSPAASSVNSTSTPNANHTTANNNHAAHGSYPTQPSSFVSAHYISQQGSATTSTANYINNNMQTNNAYPTMNNAYANYPPAGMNIYPGANYTMQLPPPQFLLPTPSQQQPSPHQQQQQQQPVSYSMSNNSHMYAQPPTVNYT